MKPLATIRRILTWLCICPFDQNTSIRKKTLFMISTWFLFAFEVSYLVSSIVFFANNVLVDVEKCLYAVLQVAASSSLVYKVIVAFILRKRINHFFGTLQTIYEESKLEWMENSSIDWNRLPYFISIFKLISDSDLDSFHHLKHANDKSELLWKYYIKYVLLGFPITTIVVATASVFYCHLTGKGFDSKYLYRPYKAS